MGKLEILNIYDLNAYNNKVIEPAFDNNDEVKRARFSEDKEERTKYWKVKKANDLLFGNTSEWWKIAKLDDGTGKSVKRAYNKSESRRVTIQLNNVIKNAKDIEAWIEESIDGTVYAFPYAEDEEVTVETTQTVKRGIFGSTEKIVNSTTETHKIAKFEFVFPTESDAMLFATTWKGVET